jgi:hypothetical protein
MTTPTAAGGGETLESAPVAPPAPRDDVRLLDPAAIAARRRPMAVAVVYLFELAWALVVATPVHAWAKRVWGSHPDGDAVLWAPGGRELMSWFGALDPALAVSTRTSLLLLFAGAMIAQIPLGALLVSLASERDGGRALRLSDALARGVGLWLPLSVVLFVASGLCALVLGVGVAAGIAVDRALIPSAGDARAFTIELVVVALFGVLALAVGVFGDLVRAAVASDSVASQAPRSSWSRLVSATKRAAQVGRRGFVRALGAWAWRAVVSVGLLAAGSLAADALGGRGGALLVALWLVHQAVVLGRTALRASFLARALRLVG